MRQILLVDDDEETCTFLEELLGGPDRSFVSVREPTSAADLIGRDLEGMPIVVRDHCYGCTAGQGSSCGGALG